MLRILLGMWCLATGLLVAQDRYAARWAELQRRIAVGQDVQQLLQEWNRDDGVTIRGCGRPAPPPLRGLFPSGLTPNRELVRVAACGVNVAPDLALAIFEHESGFDNRARGEKGELGAGQIMPSTAAAFGFDQARLAADYDYNVRSAVAIMSWLLEHFAGDEQAAIRAYNGGPAWRSASPATARQIESYAEAVNRLRRNYVIDCR